MSKPFEKMSAAEHQQEAVRLKELLDRIEATTSLYWRLFDSMLAHDKAAAKGCANA